MGGGIARKTPGASSGRRNPGRKPGVGRREGEAAARQAWANLPRSALRKRASLPLGGDLADDGASRAWRGASCRRATSSSPWPRPPRPSPWRSSAGPPPRAPWPRRPGRSSASLGSFGLAPLGLLAWRRLARGIGAVAIVVALGRSAVGQASRRLALAASSTVGVDVAPLGARPAALAFLSPLAFLAPVAASRRRPPAALGLLMRIFLPVARFVASQPPWRFSRVDPHLDDLVGHLGGVDAADLHFVLLHRTPPWEKGKQGSYFIDVAAGLVGRPQGELDLPDGDLVEIEGVGVCGRRASGSRARSRGDRLERSQRRSPRNVGVARCCDARSTSVRG